MARILILAVAPLAIAAAPAPDTLAAFNTRWEDATRQMDGAALNALWDDDGITLLPETAPIVGKPAIAAFVAKALAGMPSAHMRQVTITCADQVVSGSLASETCFAHQIIELRDGTSFDGRGRMLVVLRRGGDGRWRLLREMWVGAEPPSAVAPAAPPR